MPPSPGPDQRDRVPAFHLSYSSGTRPYLKGRPNILPRGLGVALGPTFGQQKK